MKFNISGFGYRGATQLFVEAAHWTEWVLEHQGKEGFSHENHYGLGKVIQYEWSVGQTRVVVPIVTWTFRPVVLPDATGFIAFESDWKPNNCLLLDVYGKERMRLTVPWEMTGSTHPESARAPTSFANISEPYEHPQTGEKGKFGVTAWVERMGKFYFELDYHAGKFLWCKQIRD
jgi:hypothetical protein